MPLIQNAVSVPANATIDNVLTGSQFEYLPYNATLEFGMMGGAGGTNLRIDCFSGQDILCEQMAVSTLGRFPIYPEDFGLTDVAAGGERIKIRVRNTSGVAVDFFFSLRITPI